MWDLACRLPWAGELLGDLGAVPRQAVLADTTAPFAFSLHMLSGATWFEVALLVFAAVVCTAFTLGYRTRIATVALLFLTISLHARNPLVLTGGDALARTLLFWSCFLPLGARWSLDRRGRSQESAGDPEAITGLAPAAFTLQLMSMYWFAALLKLHPAWLGEGSAVHLALQLDQIATPIGHWLGGHTTLTQLLTWATIGLEFFGPFMVLLLPGWHARVLMVVAFILLHLGFGVSLRLGTFTVFPMAAWLSLLPAEIWSRTTHLGRAQPTARIEDQVPAREPAWQLAILTIAIGLACWINLGSVAPGLRPPSVVRQTASLVGLNQRWTMFSPKPYIHDGWWIARAMLPDGKEIDLLNGGAEVRWGKPSRLAYRYRSHLWRKYFLDLWYPWRRVYRPALLRWMCDGHGLPSSPVPAVTPVRMELWYVLEVSQWPGDAMAPIPLFLESRDCSLGSVLPPPSPQPIIPGVLGPPSTADTADGRAAGR